MRWLRLCLGQVGPDRSLAKKLDEASRGAPTAIKKKLDDQALLLQTLQREKKGSKKKRAEYAEQLGEIDGKLEALVREAERKNEQSKASPTRESGIRTRQPGRVMKPRALQDEPQGLEKTKEEQIQEVLERVFEKSKRQFNQQQLYRTAREVYRSERRPGNLTLKEAAAFPKKDEVSQVRSQLNPGGGKGKSRTLSGRTPGGRSN